VVPRKISGHAPPPLGRTGVKGKQVEQTEAREMARRLTESGEFDTVFVATTADSLKQNRHSSDGEWVVLETSRTTVRVHTTYEPAPVQETTETTNHRYLLQYRDAGGSKWDPLESFESPGVALVARDDELSDEPGHLPKGRHRVVDLLTGEILEWRKREVSSE